MNHEHDPGSTPAGRNDEPGDFFQDQRNSPGSTPAKPNADDAGLHFGGQLDQAGVLPVQPQPGSEVVQVGYAAPIPPPGMLAEYEHHFPGSGKTILDDAHENQVLDREVTRASYKAGLWLEWAGFIFAAVLVLICLALALTSLLLFDPPESTWGASIFSLGAAAPLILGFIKGTRGSRK